MTSLYWIRAQVCTLWCFVFVLSILCIYVVTITELVLKQTIRVLRFEQGHQRDSIQMNWVCLTIANALTTRKQSTEIWIHTFGHIICAYEVNNMVQHREIVKLVILKHDKKIIEIDVGEHGCYIWTSRCHAISSTIYASAMASNVAFIFVHFRYAHHVTIVAQYANDKIYWYFATVSPGPFKCWNKDQN